MTEDLKHFNILNFLLLQKRNNNNLCNVSYTVKTKVLAYVSMGFLIYKFSDDFLKLNIFFKKSKCHFHLIKIYFTKLSVKCRIFDDYYDPGGLSAFFETFDFYGKFNYQSLPLT